MQDVTVTFKDGPLRGRNYEFEVGHVLIGRLPGSTGLELKGADTSVSRVHAELRELGGGIELHNVSPNGTTVDGKLILGSVKIQPGAVVQIGPNHPFTLNWKSFERFEDEDKTEQQKVATSSQGPLSSPIVRAVIGVYMVGMIAVGVWLTVSSDEGLTAADDWPALLKAYDGYLAGEMLEESRSQRVARAELLVRELRVLRTQGLNRDEERICREIMRIDKDPQSPLYQYGARCLGAG